MLVTSLFDGRLSHSVYRKITQPSQKHFVINFITISERGNLQIKLTTVGITFQGNGFRRQDIKGTIKRCP